jgi:hypothetical protein
MIKWGVIGCQVELKSAERGQEAADKLKKYRKSARPLLPIKVRNLAVVYSRLLPVNFREWLLRRGIRLIEVLDSEYETMACNILTVSPRKCIMISGNPLTRQMLEEEEVEVWEYSGEEISRKGAGGPTCLTRPLLREKG